MTCSRYLSLYGGCNTSTENLWEALDSAIHSEVGVSGVMDIWTKTQGFPWVKVRYF
jgi:hypothetical protein